MHRPFSYLALIPLALGSLLTAQQSSAVIEPFYPPFCGYIDAQLASTGGKLEAAAEQKLDTARLQKAIDRCGKGRALVLRVNEEMNAFVTGPLILRSDITLIVSRGVTIFAARDPKLFDTTPGSCTAATGAASGCKPLVSVDHATGDGIMGDGVLDGRGIVTSLIKVDNSNNFTLYRINLRNSKGSTLEFDHGTGLTLWGVHVKAVDSAASKTGGLSIGSSARNVSIEKSFVDGPSGQTELTGGGAQ